MGGRLPDFVIIGAMKAGTSSLHVQLARRSGLFMSNPKEPNFFSEDQNFERGIDWYASLFATAASDQRCGESSTHYTKLPTYPNTVDRMKACLPEARLVYVMRDPLERIASQFVHEWTQRECPGSFEQAVRENDRFTAYSCYARQLDPFLRVFGPKAVLPVFFERLIRWPDAELARICRFVGDPSPEPPRWCEEIPAQNVSSQRLRRSQLRAAVAAKPAVRALLDRTPRDVRELLKRPWRMRRRPELTARTRARIEAIVNEDLTRLSAWLGRELHCAGWKEQVLDGDSGDWKGFGR